MLNEAGQMIGSVMIMDFDTREEFDAFLEKEPYSRDKVWRDIEVIPCRLGPSFEHLMPAKMIS